MPDVNPYELQEDPIHLDEQIAFLKGEIDSAKHLCFTALFPFLKTRLRIVVTFMAILEMIQNKELNLLQKNIFGDIQLEIII